METMMINGATGMSGAALCPRSVRPLELRRRDLRTVGTTGAVFGAAAAADRGTANHPAIDVAFPAVGASG